MGRSPVVRLSDDDALATQHLAKPVAVVDDLVYWLIALLKSKIFLNLVGNVFARGVKRRNYGGNKKCFSVSLGLGWDWNLWKVVCCRLGAPGLRLGLSSCNGT